MSDSKTFQSNRDFSKAVTIKVGQTVSQVSDDVDALDTNGCEIVAIRTDANLTATSLSFQSGDSPSGIFLDYYTNDLSDPALEKQVKLTVSPSKQFAFDRENFTSVQFVKIVGNTVQLTSDSVITLVLRP